MISAGVQSLINWVLCARGVSGVMMMVAGTVGLSLEYCLPNTPELV